MFSCPHTSIFVGRQSIELFIVGDFDDRDIHPEHPPGCPMDEHYFTAELDARQVGRGPSLSDSRPRNRRGHRSNDGTCARHLDQAALGGLHRKRSRRCRRNRRAGRPDRGAGGKGQGARDPHRQRGRCLRARAAARVGQRSPPFLPDADTRVSARAEQAVVRLAEDAVPGLGEPHGRGGRDIHPPRTSRADALWLHHGKRPSLPVFVRADAGD